MKNTIRIILSIVALSWMGCDDMNSLHDKYLQGERIYLGKADSLKSYAGQNRILLKWELNTDPKIEFCCIYWNDRQDSVHYPIDPQKGPAFETIVSVPEGQYNFELITKNSKGHTSLSSEISGTSYGERFRKEAYNRAILSMKATVDSVTLNWSTIENGAGVNFEYTNRSGNQKKIFISNAQNVLHIKDYRPGGAYSYETLLIPEVGAIDTLVTWEKVSGNFPEHVALPKDHWSIAYVSSEEQVGEEDGANGWAKHMIDGNEGTFWHSQWYDAAQVKQLPHTIVIDLNEKLNVKVVEILRRGSTKLVSFSLSDNYGVDGADAVWKEIGDIAFLDDAEPHRQKLTLPETSAGRYLKLVVKESYGPPHANIKEIYLTGSY